LILALEIRQQLQVWSCREFGLSVRVVIDDQNKEKSGAASCFWSCCGLFDFHVGSSSAIKTTTTFEEKAECNDSLFQVVSAQLFVLILDFDNNNNKSY
jgi:hypothetical protein